MSPIKDLAIAFALFRALGCARGEVVGLAYLGPERRILGLRHIVGSGGRVDLAIREVVRDSIAFGAVAVVMAHNHPSGDPQPSERDRAFTRALARGLAVVEVDLLDHLVIAGDAVTSLRTSECVYLGEVGALSRHGTIPAGSGRRPVARKVAM